MTIIKKFIVVVRAFFHITLATKMEFQLSPLPPFLALPGEPPIQWSRWHESLETLVAAIRLTGAAEAKRRAVLIHSLGNEGQRIFRTLNKTRQDRQSGRMQRSCTALDMQRWLNGLLQA